jgi:hypothetical protein
MTTESILTPEQGLFELSLINAENSDRSFEDVVLDGIKAAFSLANKFFELLKMIFNAIVSYWNS